MVSDDTRNHCNSKSFKLNSALRINCQALGLSSCSNFVLQEFAAASTARYSRRISVKFSRNLNYPQDILAVDTNFSIPVIIWHRSFPFVQRLRQLSDHNCFVIPSSIIRTLFNFSRYTGIRGNSPGIT